MTGEYTYLANRQTREVEGVDIGRYTSIAEGVEFVDRSNHPCIKNPSLVASFPFSNVWAGIDYPGTEREVLIPNTSTHTIIGNDVWIGRNAKIVSGVTIGDGAIIGAEAVVAKDIPPYSVVVGNPVKIIKKRFHYKTIEKLLKICWWQWDKETVLERLEDFKDITKFIEKYA